MPDKKELKIQLEGDKISFETSEGWNVRMIVRVLSKLLCGFLYSEAFRLEWEAEEENPDKKPIARSVKGA